jgi:SAM-dependent methyltransferase
MNHLAEIEPLTSRDEISYNESHFPSLFAIEDHHFWFQVRNKIISTLVKQLVTEYQPGYRFLEIGCGNGNVLKEVEHDCTEGTVIGMDLFSKGLRFAQRRVSSPLIQADIYNPPFQTQFEMIGLFDVLEHLSDDMNVLSHMHTLLAPNGALLITVPAYMSLWSYADRLANHKWRYTLKELEQKLVQNGFQVSYITYYMASLLPLVWFRRKVANYLINHSDKPMELEQDFFARELRIRPGVNQMLTRLLSQETSLIARRRQLPFGTSLIALARKI